MGEAPNAFVALLRGVNVGGRNKLPMPALVDLFEQLGCRSVSSFIQSGNVVFLATAALARRVPSLVSREVERRFGFSAPVVLRSAKALRAVVRDNPYVAAGADPETLHVMLLTNPPTPEQIASLDPDRSPPDTFTVVGADVYLHLPNGVGRTKLTNAYFDSTLRVTSTCRNWRTLTALAERADALGSR